MKIQDSKFRQVANLILDKMNEIFDYKLFPNFEEVKSEDIETKYYDAEDLITDILEESINEFEVARTYELKCLKDDIRHYINNEEDRYEDISIDDIDLCEAKKIIDSSDSIAESYWNAIDCILQDTIRENKNDNARENKHNL